MRSIEKIYVRLVTYCKRFHPKSHFYENVKMTTKRIAILESVIIGSFDYDRTQVGFVIVFQKNKQTNKQLIKYT